MQCTVVCISERRNVFCVRAAVHGKGCSWWEQDSGQGNMLDADKKRLQTGRLSYMPSACPLPPPPVKINANIALEQWTTIGLIFEFMN